MGHNRRRFNQLVRLARPATGLGHVGRGAILHRTVQIEGNRSAISIGAKTRLHRGVQIVARSGKSSVSIAQSCKIHTYAILDAKGGNIDIGDHSTVGSFSVLYGHGGLTIGERVSIAAHCSVVAANHIFTDPDTPIQLQGNDTKGIRMGSDIWIGTGVRILDGVSVGDGAVIAAGAVVTADVAPYTVVGGVPARVIGQR